MSQGDTGIEPQPIRLVFTLERADLPRLYDELVRFHKGFKRVGRLRVLAYDGLLVQQGLLLLAGQQARTGDLGSVAGRDADPVTNGVFEAPVDG